MMLKESPALPINPVYPPSPITQAKGTDMQGIREEKLNKACKDFEALFMAKIIKAMRQTVPTAGFLGSGLNEDLFLSLFDEELSRSLAQKGGVGIGRMLYQHMSKGETQKKADNLLPGWPPQGHPFSPMQTE